MCYWTRFINDGTREGRRNEYRNSWKLKGIIEAYSMVDAIGRQDAVRRGKKKAKTVPLDTVFWHTSRVWHLLDNPADPAIPDRLVAHIGNMVTGEKQSCWSTDPYGGLGIISYSIKYAMPEVYFENDAMSTYINWPGQEHLLTTWFDPERGPYGPNPQAEAINEAWFTFSKHTKAERTLRLNLNILRENLPDKSEKTIKVITIKVRTLCLKYGINFELIDY